MDIVIDLVYVRDEKDQLTIKEAAIVSLQDDCFGHWIIKPKCEFHSLPFNVKLRNTKSAESDYQLLWEDGDCDIENFKRSLVDISDKVGKIFVFG